MFEEYGYTEFFSEEITEEGFLHFIKYQHIDINKAISPLDKTLKAVILQEIKNGHYTGASKDGNLYKIIIHS